MIKTHWRPGQTGGPHRLYEGAAPAAAHPNGKAAPVFPGAAFAGFRASAAGRREVSGNGTGET